MVKKVNEFTKNLLGIIDNENIKIEYDNLSNAKYSMFSGLYNVNVDGKDYYFSKHDTIGQIISDYFIVIDGERMKISLDLFKRMKKIYNKQKSEKSLPDLSDIGRTSKKYNL